MSSNRSVSLVSLFQEFPIAVHAAIPNLAVQGLVSDSRNVRPGDLFVAVIGESVDGHQYISEAISRGAVAIVGMRPVGNVAVPYIQVEDTRRGLGYLAAGFYGHPSNHLTMIGVTGTDGKTTTSTLIHKILQTAGRRAGMISTVRALIGDVDEDTGYHVTTPEAPDVQKYLAQMVSLGLKDAVLEATSHGLAQHRLAGCNFDIGVITNITHEHLDYHGSFAAYRNAKAQLFAGLANPVAKLGNSHRAAVLNRADDSFHFLDELTSVAKVTYGLHREADFRAEEIRGSANGQSFVAISSRTRLSISTSLIGDYNVANCLAAIATTVGVLEVPGAAAQEGIASFEGIPGRMERIDLGQDFLAIVDFAHTPNALHWALKAARKLTDGRVIAVFGSAGLRDQEKRYLMAKESIQLADFTIFTAEDPRTETLASIISEMVQGAVASGGEEGSNFWRIEDRGEALRFAVSKASSGDIVITCGKGHEQSMCFGDIEYSWDDRRALRAALSEHLGLPGPAMPYLPTQGTC
jgi:UDP-N-acetylmuramoyl-L-alanyl-D-glutamate--2,6-diaminopimelate ligase